MPKSTRTRMLFSYPPVASRSTTDYAKPGRTQEVSLRTLPQQPAITPRNPLSRGLLW